MTAALMACAPEPASAPADVPVVGKTTADLSLSLRALQPGPRWRPSVGGRLPGRRHLLPGVAGALADLEPDRSLGGPLAAALAALPAGRRELGLAGIPLDDLFAEPPLCERPRLTTTVTDGADRYELAVSVPSWVWLTDDVAPDLRVMPEACEATLDAGLVATGCDAEDRETFFPEGSACEACLQVDGDWDRCVADADCADPAPARYSRYSALAGGTAWFYGARAPMLACAPDVEGEVLLLSRDPITGPRPFDVAAWEGFCLASWDEDAGAPTWACNLAETAGHAIVEGAFGLTAWLRPEGSDATPMANRTFLASQAALTTGRTVGWSLLTDGNLAAVVTPKDKPYGWGLAPTLDPDVDPDGARMEARRFAAAMVLKTSSAVDGVVVHPFALNRCRAWTPLDDGSSRCDDVGPWSGTGMDDGFVSWWDQAAGTTYVFPYVTLVGTGLPDPSIPGGVLPHILGSTTLADPGWEGCAWPETFTPDRMPLLDTEPPEGGVKQATFDGQTWRFGRADADAVLGLATSQRRDFCFEGLD